MNNFSIWQNGMEQDGSSTGFLYLDELGADQKDGRAWLRLGAGHIQVLIHMLQARVGKGRDLYLQGSETAVQVQPGEQDFVLEDGTLHLALPQQALQELCGVLQPHADFYPLTSYPLTVELVPTKITAQDGTVREIIE